MLQAAPTGTGVGLIRTFEVMAPASFTIEAMIRGYHIYRDNWSAVIDEELPCEKVLNNLADPFAVGLMKDGTIVGHVPRKISFVGSLFLQRNGSIVCRVAGHKEIVCRSSSRWF